MAIGTVMYKKVINVQNVQLMYSIFITSPMFLCDVFGTNDRNPIFKTFI